LAALQRGYYAVLRELVDTFKLLAEGFAKATGEVKVAMVHAVVYFGFFLVIFTGSYIIREESVTKGLMMAYDRSWLSPASNPYSQLHSQEALQRGVQSDRIIASILTDILHESSDAARVRLALIHDGIATITGVDLLKFDVINSIAAPGRAPGDLLSNLSLTEWSPDLIPSLLAHNCEVTKVDNMQNAVRRNRLLSMNVAVELACPVIDVNDQVFGSVFVHWDNHDTVPNDGQLKALMQTVKEDGRRIGTALDLRKNVDD
jgi:hypothetical protein